MKEAWWVTFRLPGRGKNGTSMSGAQLSQHWQLVLLSCALLIGNRSETVGGSIGGVFTCGYGVRIFSFFSVLSAPAPSTGSEVPVQPGEH